MPQTVRITDVAREAGVSLATASRALNNVPTVNVELAEKVKETAKRLNYSPNRTAKNLRSRKSSTWAAIVPDAKNPFFTSIVEAVEDVAWKSGFQVMFCNSREDVDREQSYMREIAASRLAGAIVAVVSTSRSTVQPLIDAKIPTVLIDRSLDEFNGLTIQTDNAKVGVLAAEHIEGIKAKKVLCVCGPEDASSTEERAQSFISFMKGKCEVEFFRTDLQAREIDNRIENVLRGEERPDAVFTTNGPLTAWIYRSIKRVHLRIPEEIVLVGVDDEPWMEMVDTPVTIVAQPINEMGSLAAKILLKNGNYEGPSSGTVTLEPCLKRRVSSSLPAMR